MGRYLNYLVVFLLAVVIVSSEISFSSEQSYLIFVSDEVGVAERGASCAVKIMYSDEIVRLNASEVPDAYDIIDPDLAIAASRYGYYRIDISPGFESFVFACLSADELRTAVLEVDASDVPCDVSGEFLVC